MKIALIIAALLAAPAVTAHPYIDIAAKVEVIQSGGQPQAVRITWTYDQAFTTELLTFLEIGAVGDRVLTQAEQLEVSQNVTQWPEEFRGDIYLENLAQPENTDAKFYPGAVTEHEAEVVDGQLIERFERALTPWAPIYLAIYDPAYVSAYRIVDVSVSGDGACEARIVRADTFRAQAKLASLIAALPEGTVEQAFPAVGRDFADMVEVICP